MLWLWGQRGRAGKARTMKLFSFLKNPIIPRRATCFVATERISGEAVAYFVYQKDADDFASIPVLKKRIQELENSLNVNSRNKTTELDKVVEDTYREGI